MPGVLSGTERRVNKGEGAQVIQLWYYSVLRSGFLPRKLKEMKTCLNEVARFYAQNAPDCHSVTETVFFLPLKMKIISFLT